MPHRPLSELIDEWYEPGSEARRRFDYNLKRQHRISTVTARVYGMFYPIPLVGPVAAQFWADILGSTLQRFESRNNPGYTDSVSHIFYGALDALAWRFFNDEYVPTWADVKSGKSGRHRVVWRLRRRHAIEQAEAIAEDYFRETGTVDK